MKRFLPLLPGIALIVLGVVLVVYLQKDDPYDLSSFQKYTCPGSPTLIKPTKVKVETYSKSPGPSSSQVHFVLEYEMVVMITILNSGTKFSSYEKTTFVTEHANDLPLKKEYRYYVSNGTGRGWQMIETKDEYLKLLLNNVPKEYTHIYSQTKSPDLDREPRDAQEAYENILINCDCPRGPSGLPDRK